MSTIAMLNPDQAWTAVLRRDPAADAELVYAVTTTGIFCRPTCPSRRPARAHVVFFPSASAAQQAGFRACRRCRPHERPAEAALVQQLTAALHRPQPVSLAQLARSTGRSPFTLQRIFQRVLGVTPAQYQRQLRAASFRRQLASGSSSVTNAIYDAGFSGPGRAYENSQLGMAPGKFRAGGEGARIGYATASCPVGRLLAAATQRGLCAVILGDSDDHLTHQLRRQFPAAEIHADPGLAGILQPILSQFTEHPAALSLPLDLRATAFQMRVWEALRRIPRGQTRTYAQVARSIGRPTAVRAVARACATNPVAVVIPCHRVIGSDGRPTGYRWGLDRKNQLLALERGFSSTRRTR